MRTLRPAALLALLAVLGTLAFPAESSALSAVFINLTANGPSPATMTISAGMYPFWQNDDQVAHSVTFANGSCSIQVGPAASGGCPSGFDVGTYPYTVDGTTQATLVVTALPPDKVTLTARSHTLRHGGRLRLHGTLTLNECCLPPAVSVRGVPLVVMARPDRHHPFMRLARGATKTLGQAGYPWSLRIQPRKTAIYIARLKYHAQGEPGSHVAWSRPFKIRVSSARR